MNKKVFDVIIEWFSKDEGGRVDFIPFKKMRYAPHIGINGERVTDLNMLVNKEKALYNKYIVVRRGKKKYYLVIFE